MSKNRQQRKARQRGRLRQESAVATPVRVREVGTSVAPVAPVAGLPQRRKVTIISAGWGSSGYYGMDMLERDIPEIYPPGTHMYMNHPSETEDMDQPERRVEHMAAVLTTVPVRVGDEMVAEADVYAHWAPVVEATAKDIGVSIRAIGMSHYGEAEGRKGDIIDELTEGISVDFVTKAGRGGKVHELMESAEAKGRSLYERTTDLDEARNMGHWLEAKIHREFTWIADGLFADGHLTREERKGLSGGISAALDAFSTHIESNLPELLQRDPFSEPGGAQDVEETSRPSDGTTKESRMSDAERLSEMENRLKQLETTTAEAEARATAAEKERDDAKVAAERAEDKVLADAADRKVAEALESDDIKALALPERAVKRVKAEATKGKLPVDAEGKLIESELKDRVERAAKEEHDYLTDGSSKGTVRGVGESEAQGSEESDKKLGEAFGRLGMSEAATTTAVRGR